LQDARPRLPPYETGEARAWEHVRPNGEAQEEEHPVLGDEREPRARQQRILPGYDKHAVLGDHPVGTEPIDSLTGDYERAVLSR
jgi:hypothetical protein